MAQVCRMKVCWLENVNALTEPCLYKYCHGYYTYLWFFSCQNPPILWRVGQLYGLKQGGNNEIFFFCLKTKLKVDVDVDVHQPPRLSWEFSQTKPCLNWWGKAKLRLSIKLIELFYFKLELCLSVL
jgi:hypothetical protein